MISGEPAPPRPSAGASPTSRRLLLVTLIVGTLLVFLAHFRPWEIAFLEEWPLAEFWSEQGGWAFATHYFEWSLSRPLHLVPTGIGLAIAGGAPWGIFLVLGIVSAAQFLVVVWSLLPVSRSHLIPIAVALIIALHPLWPGGYLQRFLPAQTAALALFALAGWLIRWLMGGRARLLVFAAIGLILGLCVYPGPAVAAPLLALVMALAVRASWRRRIVAILVVVAACAVMTLYSLVISRLIAPGGGTYEAGNFAAGTIAGPREILTYVGNALLGPGLPILASILAIAGLAAVLALTGAIPHTAGWLMAGTAIVSPLCAGVFFGNVAWLQDIERIAYAISLGLGVALLVWPMTTVGRRIRLESVIAVALIGLALLGAVRGIERWQPYIALQHQLFEELAPVVAAAEGDEIVVVVDHSGTYGFEYTLPQYYISSASHIVNDDDTRVWLCHLESDPPLGSAGVCAPTDTGDDMRLVSTFSVPTGEVDLYIGEPTTGG